MKPRISLIYAACLAIIFAGACRSKRAGQEEMIAVLNKAFQESNVSGNPLYPKAGLVMIDSLLLTAEYPEDAVYYKYMRGKILLALGEEEEAIHQFEELVRGDETALRLEPVWRELGVAYLRRGERANCISNHAAESCILPISGKGIHSFTDGSSKAIEVYKRLLTRNPNDLESKWLLNLAYMTLGEYPARVPTDMLIPGMEGDTVYKVLPFQDMAGDLKLDVNNMAGGSIVEDFDNDGYLDIMTSGWGTDESMHYFKNNADGSFTDLSDKVGLDGITGGLNLLQADYDNDGYTDVLVLRGAWKREFGKEPNSLLKNNGDGTFSDVTIASGMLSFHPTQTATWNDFNNDGWLDLFVGNETPSTGKLELHPCELFINNQNGTFREIARLASCEVFKYVKGVTSGDFDNDGWKDIFVSTLDGQRILLKNNRITGKEISFTDVTVATRLDQDHGNSFPAWFWDYDNDGWLDIFTCDYTYAANTGLGAFIAAEQLNIPAGNPEKMLLYHNNQDGTFSNVANDLGLNKNAFAMGSNFGDIDNDGYLDVYLGTGDPDFKSIIPNKLFRNDYGTRFQDVTASARVGHLQKGHGVSFADIDNDGDEDIYIEMGGIYPGDTYQNSFFVNPGQNNNHWICLKLEGASSNRNAIGTRVKVTFHENGKERTIYRDVNSGGSFGASPLRREIGIGQANLIDELEIRWHGGNTIQTFRNINPDQFIKIVEGSNEIQTIPLKSISWAKSKKFELSN